MDEIITKKCSKCGEVKLLSEFYIKKNGKYGRTGQCSVCIKQIKKEYNQNNIYKVRKLKREDYHKNKDRAKEYQQKNSDRIKEVRKIYYHNNKDRIRVRDRKKQVMRYGIDLEEYQAMFEKQAGACWICKQVPDKNLAIDHNHNTKKVRGLLCNRCNLALGYAKEDKNILQNMVRYLEEFEGECGKIEERKDVDA